MYLEDVELGWRARLHGLRVVVEPGADVLHEYEFSRNADKLALLERNRLVFVLSAYSLRLLLLLGPVLFAVELAMLGLSARQRWLGGKLRGWGWLLARPRWLLATGARRSACAASATASSRASSRRRSTRA